MIVEIDDDVGAVAMFMQRNFSAFRLCQIADEMARLAPLLWARHGTSACDLVTDPVLSDIPTTYRQLVLPPRSVPN